jgi:diguanylate cyclase (GGDEF)-like protein/PAS domain S-box-containing protein
LARLRELLILDTAPEPMLDQLVQWAAEVCDAPIALISLIDSDRQWFMANHGLPGVTETPRSQAFCAHAILGEALFEVSDAAADPRFQANPLVTGEPGIRFYAGMPLAMAGGERIGTLCVIDRQARTLSAGQAQTLSRLAHLAAQAVQMRGELMNKALKVRTAYEEQLAASEMQHRAIVEEQSELICLARADGTLQYVNLAYAQTFGGTAASLSGRSLFDCVPPAEHALVRQRIEFALRGDGPAVGENRMLDAEGKELWVAWTHSVHVHSDGSLLLRSVGRDISAQKLAETALRANENFLRRTGRVAGVGGWELELSSGTLIWSQETRRIHDVPDTFVPTLANAIDFYGADARPRIEAAVRLATSSGMGWDLELPLTTATGRAIWVRAVGEVEFEAGQPVRLVGAVQDISVRKALEMRLEESELFVRDITDKLAVRLAYVDRQLKHRFVNQAYCDRFGLPRERILGRTRAELLGGTELPLVAIRVTGVLAGEPQHFEFEEEVDGQRLRIESRLRPDLDEQGKVRGFFATGINITERHRDEQALRVLKSSLDQSTDFILQTGLRGDLLYMNPAARKVAGVAPHATLQGIDHRRFNTPATNQLILAELLPAVRRDGVWRGETEVRTAEGSVLPVSHVTIAHYDAEGRPERFSTVLRDITSEVKTRQMMQRQSATLRSVTEALPVIVSAVDNQRRYRFVNSAFEQWHGLRRENVLGRLASEVLTSEEVAQSDAWARRAAAGESVHFERHYPHRKGQPTLSLSYIPVRLDNGQTDGFVAVGYDITSHRQEQLRLRALAEKDVLTGLLNRAGFQSTLEQALKDGQGPELALLYLDLDHFKPINDRHGHATGDAVLSAFAQRLTGLVRPTDTIARLGGDEFALLLPGLTDAQAAHAVAAKVVAAAALPFELGRLQLQIGASVGLAFGVKPLDNDGSDLLRRADTQLYRAKNTGRGRYASEWATLDV